MSVINIDQLIQALESGVDTLAKTTLQDYVSQAKADGENAIGSLKSNLQQWTLELESGALKADDIAFLLKEEAALDEMTALKQAGLAEIRIDQFKTNLITMITNTIFSFIKV
ncbi:hypothetical protein I5907_11805 [Panacibacter sp. DH6]|uniref:Uncharacterized protein n=1 Tax=Panacibacter microcysteis TaxID=2793269 RepID=A0A931E7R0_9BACT|nr:hypothetical protein [Panacibacter microcysteis]MBG9376926.1 hypothetical protein [Panacibacter microcysteis]